MDIKDIKVGMKLRQTDWLIGDDSPIVEVVELCGEQVKHRHKGKRRIQSASADCFVIPEEQMRID